MRNDKFLYYRCNDKVNFNIILKSRNWCCIFNYCYLRWCYVEVWILFLWVGYLWVGYLRVNEVDVSFLVLMKIDGDNLISCFRIFWVKIIEIL